MPQRVKPVTRLVGGSLSASMTGVGVVGFTAQEVTGAGAHAVSVGVASSGSGSAVIPGEAYTLADSTTGLPFAVTHPTAPTLTPDDEVTVTPETIAANKVNGRRIILSAGEYGSQSFNTQDQEIVFTPGANFGRLSIGSDARRLRFTADPVRSGSVGYITTEQWQPPGSRPTDLLFDGINQVHIAGGEFSLDNVFAVDRLAIISSYLQARNFALSCFHYGCTDLIFANNNSTGGDRSLQYPGDVDEAGHRINPVTRFVFVDNRAVKGEGPKQVFRLHGGIEGGTLLDSTNIYIARNQMEGNGNWISASGTSGASVPGVAVGRVIGVWFEDNHCYMDPASIQRPLKLWGSGIAASVDYPEDVIVRNNVSHGAPAGGWPTLANAVNGSPSWTLENNTVVASSWPPPSWEFQ